MFARLSLFHRVMSYLVQCVLFAWFMVAVALLASIMAAILAYP
jgi:hypothetical protein